MKTVRDSLGLEELKTTDGFKLLDCDYYSLFIIRSKYIGTPEMTFKYSVWVPQNDDEILKAAKNYSEFQGIFVDFDVATKHCEELRKKDKEECEKEKGKPRSREIIVVILKRGKETHRETIIVDSKNKVVMHGGLGCMVAHDKGIAIKDLYKNIKEVKFSGKYLNEKELVYLS